jgi:putative DNA primase/helicase
MDTNTNSSNDKIFIPPSSADHKESTSSLSDNLQSSLFHTIKNLLPPAEEPSNNTAPASLTAQEERFKTRSRERHSQQFSDTTNARRFVSLHQSSLRYVPLWDTWLLWDGKRWYPDTYDNISTFARSTLQSFRDEALSLPYEQRKLSTLLFDHADRSESPKHLASMLSLARHNPDLIADPQLFDADSLLLNVLNGTVNLRTNQLQPHNPHDFITHLAPVLYDPAACSPTWDKFLSDITNHDPDLQRFLQLAVGYSLTSCIQEQVIFLLHGPGCNGKNTFLNAIRSILGDFAAYASRDLVTSRSLSTSSSSLPASLLRKRLIIIPTLGLDLVLDIHSIEHVTGGELTATSASTTHPLFPLYPQLSFKLWMATNHLPSVRDYSAAAWRRIKLIHFPVSFQGREDKYLASKLQADTPAILNWAIQGCLTWQREGLPLPSCVQQATINYQDEQDALAPFLRSRCLFAPHLSVKASDLYHAYLRWSQEAGVDKPLDARAFSRHILAHGYHRAHRMTGNVYLGFSLAATPDSSLSQSDTFSENYRLTYYDIPGHEGS